MMERLGMETFTTRYLEAVHEDEFRTLFRRDFGSSEPPAMVRVRNSTAEADGSHRYYFLRVPPEVNTARKALAWAFETAP